MNKKDFEGIGFGFGIMCILTLFMGMWLGACLREPDEIKNKDCIIYNHEIYCKEQGGK